MIRSASLEELNPQEVTKLLGGKVKVLMESVDHPQACLFECKTRQDGKGSVNDGDFLVAHPCSKAFAPMCRI